MSHWFWPAFQREIRSSWKKLALTAMTLCIGMTTLTSLLLTDARLEVQTRRQADSILGGDAEISDVRLLPESLVESVQNSSKIARKSRVTSFVTMTNLPQNQRPRLIEVLAIDDSFPLVPGMKINPSLSYETLRSGGILVEKSFAQTHNLQTSSEKFNSEISEKLGQKLLSERKALKIGKRVFPIIGIVENDQMRDFASFSLGSRLYMAREVALKQKLISTQSRLRDRLLVQFPSQSSAGSSVSWLREELTKIETGRPNLRNKEDALNAAFKPARSLFLFFNAIGFASLLLLGLGSAQGIHSYLKRKQNDALILSNLGAQRPLLTVLFAGNVVVITAIALALGAWFGQLLYQHQITPRMNSWIANSNSDILLLSQSKVSLKFALSVFILILSLILPGTLSFLRRQQPHSLALSLSSPSDSIFKKAFFSLIAILENFPDLVWLVAAFLLSFIISNETGFNLLLVMVLSSLYLVIRFLVVVISRLGLSPNIRFPLSLRLAGSEIAARPTQSSLTLLLFSLSVCLLVFLWDLRSNIVDQISVVTSGNQRPNVFVLDAPPDSIKSVRTILSSESPDKNLILAEKITRARLSSINNKSIDEWILQFDAGSDARQRAERLLNREQNLTSRAQLSDGKQTEEVIAGQFWKKESAKLALNEVSVEAGLAQNLRLKLNDVIQFDVQGVPVKVKITSLRKVYWQSFRPNFFFVLHPSTLVDAPYSGLFATNLPDNKKRQEVINTLFENHPGVTTIDATELAEMATKLLNSALEMVRFLTVLLFIGALINTVLGAWTSFSLRAQNFSLYRCLGANNSLVLRAIFGEFILLSVVGCGVGVSASWLLSMLVQKTILSVDDQLKIAILPSAVISGAVIFICVAAAFVSGVLILRQAPFRLLRKPN